VQRAPNREPTRPAFIPAKVCAHRPEVAPERVSRETTQRVGLVDAPQHAVVYHSTASASCPPPRRGARSLPSPPPVPSGSVLAGSHRVQPHSSRRDPRAGLSRSRNLSRSSIRLETSPARRSMGMRFLNDPPDESSADISHSQRCPSLLEGIGGNPWTNTINA
jgi:hypothetical protein